MENTNRYAVTLEQVNIGDIIYLSPKDDAVPYQVLDKGTPFILIENCRSHFANLFRPMKELYKDNPIINSKTD